MRKEREEIMKKIEEEEPMKEKIREIAMIEEEGEKKEEKVKIRL